MRCDAMRCVENDNTYPNGRYIKSTSAAKSDPQGRIRTHNYISMLSCILKSFIAASIIGVVVTRIHNVMFHCLTYRSAPRVFHCTRVTSTFTHSHFSGTSVLLFITRPCLLCQQNLIQPTVFWSLHRHISSKLTVRHIGPNQNQIKSRAWFVIINKTLRYYCSDPNLDFNPSPREGLICFGHSNIKNHLHEIIFT